MRERERDKKGGGESGREGDRGEEGERRKVKYKYMDLDRNE
jgi:hypothetical protein